jgi:ADP-dependent NAD(P)H-hydrate dehydratase
MPADDDAGAEVLVSPATLRNWPLPSATGSKHSRGHVLVAGGSPSTPGAVMLAGLAALRVGAGVLALAVARSVAPHVAVAVPEASVHGFASLDDRGGDTDEALLEDALSGHDTICVGPGLDDPDAAEWLLRAVLDSCGAEARLVLDAFALGVLPGLSDDDLGRLAGRSVLTPNGSEAARLLDTSSDDIDGRESRDVAVAVARRYNCVVAFERHIADPAGRGWHVESGHPGLGTSGSGDVLAGAAAGLLARGSDPAQAACWATYLHATAGDRLAPRVGRLGFLAREVVDELPLVLVEIEA